MSEQERWSKGNVVHVNTAETPLKAWWVHREGVNVALVYDEEWAERIANLPALESQLAEKQQVIEEQAGELSWLAYLESHVSRDDIRVYRAGFDALRRSESANA